MSIESKIDGLIIYVRSSLFLSDLLHNLDFVPRRFAILSKVRNRSMSQIIKAVCENPSFLYSSPLRQGRGILEMNF